MYRGRSNNRRGGWNTKRIESVAGANSMMGMMGESGVGSGGGRRSGTRWTEEEHAQLVNEIEQPDLTCFSMAQTHGRTENSVRLRVVQIMNQRGDSIESIAARLQLQTQDVADMMSIMAPPVESNVSANGEEAGGNAGGNATRESATRESATRENGATREPARKKRAVSASSSGVSSAVDMMAVLCEIRELMVQQSDQMRRWMAKMEARLQ